jgi:intracellular sulfur oxidation DsrE/DsrF family protein
MNCADVGKLLHPYLDRELDPPAAVGVAQHLAACARCAAEFERHKTASRLIKAAMRPEPDAAGSLHALRRALQIESRPANGWRRQLIFVAPALAAAVLLAWVLVPLLPGAAKGERYVYHVSNADNAAVALANIAFHLAAAPKAHFVVVTHNEGVDFLLQGAKDASGTPFASRVAALAEHGVQFRVCLNTLRVRDIPRQRVVAQATFVPSGIAEVGRLQVEEHYAYLKP